MADRRADNEKRTDTNEREKAAPSEPPNRPESVEEAKQEAEEEDRFQASDN
jgi:hypothetical protein